MTPLRGNKWITLGILCIGFLMILIDTTIVNVSIPTIIKDLGANLTDIEWIISGYALSFAALLITFGRIGDLYGRKALFLSGLLVFTIASVLSGEASSSTTLIFSRLLQGVGGAMISPATLSLISSNFKGRERATAFGIWGAIAGIAVAIGPILGGFLTTYYSWRWIFRVNIPIGIVGMIAGWLIISESKESTKQRIDIAGMATSAIGFFFLIFALIEGQNYGWITTNKPFIIGGFTWDSRYSVIPYSFVLSILFLLVFILIQIVKTKNRTDPAVNITFFSSRAFRYGLVAIGVISLGEFSSLFTTPIFLQSVKGFTPLQSGYAVLPLAIATMIAAPISAKIVNLIGTKWVITTGIFLEFIGLILLSRITINTTYSQLILPYFILGAGIGLAIAQNTQVILSDIPVEQSGSASGVLNTVRQVGTALGIAIIGAVLTSNLKTNLIPQVRAINLPVRVQDAIITKAGDAGVSYDGASSTVFSRNPVIGEQLNTGIFTALTQSIATAIRAGSIFVFIGAALSLLIPNVKASKSKD